MKLLKWEFKPRDNAYLSLTRDQRCRYRVRSSSSKWIAVRVRFAEGVKQLGNPETLGTFTSAKDGMDACEEHAQAIERALA